MSDIDSEMSFGYDVLIRSFPWFLFSSSLIFQLPPSAFVLLSLKLLIFLTSDLLLLKYNSRTASM